MTETVQQILVGIAILGAIVYLARRFTKKSGCGSDCGTSCAAKTLPKAEAPPKDK